MLTGIVAPGVTEKPGLYIKPPAPPPPKPPAPPPPATTKTSTDEIPVGTANVPGELNVEIPLIISNHKNLSHVADIFGIPFHHIEHNRNCKDKAQAKQIKLLEKYNIDFIVLARYMQIIGEDITAKYPNKIINIHHSFLPAFAGAKPYHSAFNRGVKIIGATSHYVINELDAGPIIEQSTKRVSHLNSIEDLIVKGRDLEKIVLSRAITLHLQNKILVSNNKTIIFS